MKWKEYILNLLKWLWSKWEYGSKLYELILNDKLVDTGLDSIITNINHSIKDTYDEKLKDWIEQVNEYLENLRNKEAIQRVKEQENLDSMFDDID